MTAATQIAHTDTSSANANITAATQINQTDNSSANTNITAAPQITHTNTSSANTNITTATQISHTDTSAANANITAVTQISHRDTAAANTNMTAATHIAHPDNSSANANKTAATQINHTDNSSANTNITAEPQISHTEPSSAKTNITTATQINHTDTSAANTNINAVTQISHTDTAAANTNITAATRVNLTRFRDHSWRTRHCGELIALTQTVAVVGERLRTVANIDTTFREHSLTPRPPNETGTLATHSGKNAVVSGRAWRRFCRRDPRVALTPGGWPIADVWWETWTYLATMSDLDIYVQHLLRGHVCHFFQYVSTSKNLCLDVMLTSCLCVVWRGGGVDPRAWFRRSCCFLWLGTTQRNTSISWALHSIWIQIKRKGRRYQTQCRRGKISRAGVFLRTLPLTKALKFSTPTPLVWSKGRLVCLDGDGAALYKMG